MAYFIFIPLIYLLSFTSQPGDDSVVVKAENKILILYEHLELSELLDYDIFERAVEGYWDIDPADDDILTIIDYTKASTEERMFVLDLENKELLIKTLVAHGKNSGANTAEYFSNQAQSLQSSPGFYITAETYTGKHGYSLRLDGIEKNINDKARERAIVIHGADYVSESFISKQGRLGRSWGCPAVPTKDSKEIIDMIKGGTCLYIHTEAGAYPEESVICRE